MDAYQKTQQKKIKAIEKMLARGWNKYDKERNEYLKWMLRDNDSSKT